MSAETMIAATGAGARHRNGAARNALRLDSDEHKAAFGRMLLDTHDP